MVALRYPLEEIRSRVSLTDVVGAYVRLRKAGKNLVGLCPFHTEKTPSFTVSEEHQRWRCYGCEASGDVFNFLMKMEGLTFADAVEQLARRAGVEIKQGPATAASDKRQVLLQIVSAAAFFFRQQLSRSEKAQDYLKERGVTDDAIEKYAIGYAPDSWDALLQHLSKKSFPLRDAHAAGLVIAREQSEGFYDRFRNRLIFPIHDLQDRPIGFGGRAFGDDQPKYLNSPETPLFVKNKTLYGLNFARRWISQEDRVIIVEGYFDALTAQMAGFGNVVATMGTALTGEHVSILARYTHNAVMAFDSDSAGMSAALRSAAMFEEADFAVRVADLPTGQDPDSLLRSGQRDAFARLINEAVELPQFRLNKVLAQHELSTQEGQIKALRQATAVIADVASAAERERLMDQMLQYHPTSNIDTARALASIRADVERIITRQKPTFQRPRQGGEQAAAPAEKQAAASRVHKAEISLLRAAIEDADLRARLPEELGCDGFVSPGARELLEAIERLNADVAKITQEVGGTDAESLLNEALVSDGAPGGNEQEFSDCIKLVQIHHKRQKERRLRALTSKIDNGEITRNDEEFAEYWRLVQELH